MMSLVRRSVPALALAALFALTLTAVAADAKGRVKSVTAARGEVVMVDDANKSWTLVAAKDCKVKVNDTDSKLEDLQAGDEITVTYEKDGDKLIVRSVRATRK
jgi:multidrug resistance efflux pump